MGDLAGLRLDNSHRGLSVCFTFAGGGSCYCGVVVTVFSGSCEGSSKNSCFLQSADISEFERELSLPNVD